MNVNWCDLNWVQFSALLTFIFIWLLVIGYWTREFLPGSKENEKT